VVSAISDGTRDPGQRYADCCEAWALGGLVKSIGISAADATCTADREAKSAKRKDAKAAFIV
jgi:hypothetical protein